MKKSSKVVLLLILLSMTLHISSATIKWTLVTSYDQIESGKIYLVSAYAPTKKTNYLFYPELKSGNVYAPKFKAEKMNAASTTYTVTGDRSKYLCFKLTEEKSGWTLYNIYTKKYNGIPSTSQVFSESSSPDGDAYHWNISSVNDTVLIQHINAPLYRLAYNFDGNYLQLYTQKNKMTVALSLYKLTSYTLDSSTAYTDEDAVYAVPVSLERTFTADAYNTLSLPCDVNDYKTIFGAATEAYELSSYAADDKQIHFSAVTGSNLKANAPYIISGTAFNSSPYNLGCVELSSCNETLQSVTSNSNCKFIGVYSQTTLGGTDAYVLYNKKFYSCKTRPTTFGVSPYRCYFTFPSASYAKVSVGNGDLLDIDEVTDVDEVVNENALMGKDGATYNMWGAKIQQPASGQHGIYIMNGKKYAK